MSEVNGERGPALILGAEGMLGGALMDRFCKRFGKEASDRVVGWDLAELDIVDGSAVVKALGKLRPSIVLNAAAYTDVDGCESNVELATAVNGRAPGHIAEVCSQIDATMVHFGTDFIFDGKSNRPYRPDDKANPLSVYGRSKWEGEQAVRAAGCRHLIVRTSWLFGPGGRNFVEAILSRARAGEILKVVDDQVGSPTLTVDLVDAVERLLDAKAEGTIQFSNAGYCSWFEFAEKIVEKAGFSATLQAITSDQLNRPALRPRYSVLDTRTYVSEVGVEPRPWQDALISYLKERTARMQETYGSGITRDSQRH